MVAVCTVVNERPLGRDSMAWLVACLNPSSKIPEWRKGSNDASQQVPWPVSLLVCLRDTKDFHAQTHSPSPMALPRFVLDSARYIAIVAGTFSTC